MKGFKIPHVTFRTREGDEEPEATNNFIYEFLQETK